MVAAPQFSHHIYKNLDERGILDAALAAGWTAHPSGNGFQVPVYDLAGTRCAWAATYNVAAEARKQFGKVNLSGKPQNIRYYLLPDLRAAIASDNGTCYLASGLTDLLSFRAAGVHNVIAPLGGEYAIPDTFAEDLQKLGVRKLIYLPDKDQAGERSARKVTARVKNSSIKLKVQDIPGSANDINELWVGLTNLGHAAGPVFRAALTAAKNHKFKRGDSTQTPKPHKKHSSEQQSLYQELGVKHFKNGKSNPLHCCFHNDENPSAVLFENKESGKYVYHCSVCGSTTEDKLHEKNHPEPFWQPDNNSISLRQELLQQGHNKLARFIDITLNSHVKLGHKYTTKQLHQQLEKHYTLNALHRLTQFFAKKYPILFSVTLNRDKTAKKPGRPPKQYRIPTLQELCKHFGVLVMIESEQPMPPGALTSAKNYRMAVHREHIERHAPRWKEKEQYPAASTLAKKIGVTARTLWRYEREMPDLGRKRRFDEETVPEIYELTPSDRDRGAYLVRRGQQKIIRYPLPSERWITPEPFQETPAPDRSELYCRNCGQQPMFPDDPPRVCDFCGAIHPWQNEPPPVAPEMLRENGRIPNKAEHPL